MITSCTKKVFTGARVEIYPNNGALATVYGDVFVSDDKLFIRIRGHLLNSYNKLISGDILESIVVNQEGGMCTINLVPRNPEIDVTYTTHSVELVIAAMDEPKNKTATSKFGGPV